MKSPSKTSYKNIETISIHEGADLSSARGMVGTPIYQTSTFEMLAQDELSSVRYTRLNNGPNHLALNKKIAALEGAEAAVVSASGMASISVTLLATLGKNGHVLLPTALYGGTYAFATEYLEDMGHSFSWVDIDDEKTWEKNLKPNTKVFWIESVSNPTLQVPDYKKYLAFCKKHKLITIIDNTFLSPYNFKPIDLGFDLVIQSCTKYLNGHSDIIAGSVAGSAKWVDKIKAMTNLFGGTLDPHACFLLDRGIKTLSVRVKAHNENALAFAGHLSKHKQVERVLYPGLKSHPHYERVKKYYRGCGGVVCFELTGSLKRTEKFLSSLKIPKIAPSLGGVESLIGLPTNTSNGKLSEKEKMNLGITPKLIRFAIGIENIEDLIADFEQAL